jgi:hypothetical protein
MPSKEPHQGQFGVLVAARADAGHHLGPFRFGENVRHDGGKAELRAAVARLWPATRKN